MKILFKLLALIFAGYFVWASSVQYNDPDAMTWYAIYGVAIIASILFLVDKLNFISAVVLIVAYIIGAVVFWPEQYEGITIGEGDIVNIERGREAVGLLIVALVMLLYALRIKYVAKAKV